MILDTLAHSSRYSSFGARINLGFEYLAAFSPEVADGRYDLDGDAVFALVQSYLTLEPGEKKFESHRQYLDIQYVAEGVERVQYAPIDSLVAATPYVTERDCTHYRDTAQATDLIMRPGFFAIFFPNDGHKPGCIADHPVRVRKVVIKARL